MAESTLRLSGMYCAACAGIIEQALVAVDGVSEATVSAAGQRAAVRWDPLKTRPSRLVEAIRRAGYDAAPDAAAPARELRRAESAPGAVAPVRRRLLHDAGDDAGHAVLRGRRRASSRPTWRNCSTGAAGC